MKAASLLALAISLPCMVVAGQSAAQDHVATHKSWAVLEKWINHQRVCYVASFPNKSMGNYSRRGATYMQIAWWQNSTHQAQIRIEAGYPYQAGSEVSVSVDTGDLAPQVYSFFTDGSTAWAQDEAQQADLLAMMKRHYSLTVKGTSSRGTETTDIYDLHGLSLAISQAEQKCKF